MRTNPKSHIRGCIPKLNFDKVREVQPFTFMLCGNDASQDASMNFKNIFRFLSKIYEKVYGGKKLSLIKYPNLI